MSTRIQESATITGRHGLKTRQIAVDGSTRTALPMLAAAAATGLPVVLFNVPGSGDVQTMLGLIETCGWSVTTSGDMLAIDPSSVSGVAPEADLSAAAKVSDSYYLVPALLSVFGRAELPYPNGGEFVERAMELKFRVYEAFGDLCVGHESGYRVTAGHPPPQVDIELPYPSRGATIAALVRAASASSTRLVIDNPDTSPESIAVFNCLIGLAWDGHLSPDRLTLIPRKPVAEPSRWIVPGDKTEAAILACALMATGGSGDITGVPARAMSAFCKAVNEIGLNVEPDKHSLYIRSSGRSRERRWTGINGLASAEPRGLDPDFEPLLMALALACPGQHAFQDEINPGRHSILIPQLAALGAQVNELSSTIATFNGPQRLVGAPITAGDSRTGAALIIAALQARGTTVVTGLEHVRRDYANLPGKLASLGAAITTTS